MPPGPTRSASRLVRLQQAARSRLWPLPLVMVLAGVLVGYSMPLLDARVDGRLPDGVVAVIFSGDPETGRAVLSAIAGSLVTVTSLTFSLTVVTLQLASSQFTPRLLRTFVSDVFTQFTLGLFLSTFAYSLVVLRTVTSPEGGDPFVPQLSITAAVVAVIFSALQLVLFIAHLSRQIRAETILDRVRDDALATIERELQDPDETTPEPLRPPADARVLLSPGTGMLQSVDGWRLRQAAVDCGAVVRMDRAPGQSTVKGVPVALAWAVDGGDAGELDLDALQDAVDEAVFVGEERTAAQDVGFGLRQLVDIAARALSPGVNDPTTAVHAISNVSGLLCALLGKSMRPTIWHDEQDRPRLSARRGDLADVLDMAFGQVRRYGASETAVVARLLQMLRETAWHARTEEQRSLLRRELQRLDAVWPHEIADEVDRDVLRDSSALVEEALAGRWPAR